MREPSHTKAGPGRKAHKSKNSAAPRTKTAPVLTKPLPANVGREPRRVWRDGEPVHIVKPVRAQRRARDEEATEARRVYE